MITKIIIPVIDTESLQFDYGENISREVYSQMEYDEFRRTNGSVNVFVHNMLNNRSNYRDVHDYIEVYHPDIQYTYSEAEAFLQDGKKEEANEEYLIKHFENEDMFILLINVNTNKLDQDAESELRYWLDDSRRIQEDRTIDNKTKLKLLPARFLKIEINGETYVMNNCKILQNYSNEKWHYYFAIIAEKIIKE